MKQLTLVRHAHAADTGPDGERVADIDRPLADRGYPEIASVAPHLDAGGTVSVVSSEALRARQTAAEVIKLLGLDASLLTTHPAMYGAGADDIIDIIGSTDEEITRLFIVGHNPALTELVNLICGAGAVTKMVPGSAAQVTLAAERWVDTGPNNGELQSYRAPE